MIGAVLSKLGVRLIVPSLDNPAAELYELEDTIDVSVPEDYRLMLLEYGASLVFEKDIGFYPIEHTPRDRKDGTQSLEILYGLGSGDDSLREVFRICRGRLPPDILPIGGLPGGDQLCLSYSGPKAGNLFFWDHEAELQIEEDEDPAYSNMYLVAESFSDFLQCLFVRDDSNDESLGAIESESFLDF
jgi:hypothetical protein